MVRRINVGPAPTPFKIIIDKQSTELNAKGKKIRASMYASDFGNCQRKVWFQFNPDIYPVEQEVDAQTARVFANGNDVHERLSAYLKLEESIKFVEEVNVPRDELDVHGRCDGIADHGERFHVLEFKSINAQGVAQAKSEHEGQVLWYLDMFEKSRLELRDEFGLGQAYYDEEALSTIVSKNGRSWTQLSDVERRLLLSQGPVKGEIIYESKMNQSTHHFPLEYDEEKAEAVRQWFITLKKHVDEKRKPDVHYDKTAFPCSWGRGDNIRRCAYYEYCHGEKKPEGN